MMTSDSAVTTDDYTNVNTPTFDIALRLTLVTLVLTGLAYPLAVTVVARAVFSSVLGKVYGIIFWRMPRSEARRKPRSSSDCLYRPAANQPLNCSENS